MILKLVLKSHFKILKDLKKKKDLKKIFLKGVFIFLLSTEFFLQNCKISFNFSKKRTLNVNLLKSPMRFKKFFNQIFTEIFFLKIFLKFSLNKIDFRNSIKYFSLLNNRFVSLGTNLLLLKKTRITFISRLDDFFKI